MESIGELHEDDTDITRHREKHLAQIFCIAFDATVLHIAFQFGHAIYE